MPSNAAADNSVRDRLMAEPTTAHVARKPKTIDFTAKDHSFEQYIGENWAHDKLSKREVKERIEARVKDHYGYMEGHAEDMLAAKYYELEGHKGWEEWTRQNCEPGLYEAPKIYYRDWVRTEASYDRLDRPEEPQQQLETLLESPKPPTDVEPKSTRSQGDFTTDADQHQEHRDNRHVNNEEVTVKTPQEQIDQLTATIVASTRDVRTLRRGTVQSKNFYMAVARLFLAACPHSPWAQDVIDKGETEAAMKTKVVALQTEMDQLRSENAELRIELSKYKPTEISGDDDNEQHESGQNGEGGEEAKAVEEEQADDGGPARKRRRTGRKAAAPAHANGNGMTQDEPKKTVKRSPKASRVKSRKDKDRVQM